LHIIERTKAIGDEMLLSIVDRGTPTPLALHGHNESLDALRVRSNVLLYSQQPTH